MCFKMIIYCLRATKLNLQSHAGIVLNIKMPGEIFLGKPRNCLVLKHCGQPPIKVHSWNAGLELKH